MGIESRVRVPQEESARFKVYRAIIEDNVPVWDTRAIAGKTGLPRKQVTAARSNLRADGLLPKPTKELTRLTQHTQAATVFPLVQEYREEMGLSLREIQFAVKSEKGVDLNYESVHSAIRYNTKTGKLRRLSKQELSDITKDANALSEEETQANVTAILHLRRSLVQDNQPLPTNRLEWKKAIKKDSVEIVSSPKQNRQPQREMTTKSILQFLLDAGEKGIAIEDLAKPAIDAGVDPDRAASTVRQHISLLRKRGFEIENLTPMSERYNGVKATYRINAYNGPKVLLDAGDIELAIKINIYGREMEFKRQLFTSRNLHPLLEPTELNEKDIGFLHALILNDFIDNDPVFFETLEDLFAKSNRQEDFENLSPEVKLRLEAFARAIMQEVKENRTDLRTKFAELGLQFGKEWFYDKNSTALKEQKFIADKIRPRYKAPITPQAVNATRTIPLTTLDIYRDGDPE